MSAKNPKVDVVVGKTRQWREETEKLREVLLDSPLTEELKWWKPCYTLEGRVVAIIGGFKDNCVVSFFKGALLKDPKGVLEKPGENSQAARVMRFRSVAEIEKSESVLRAFIKEAIAVEKAGVKVEFKKSAEFEVPEELRRKFGESASFKKAWEGLTPGRQRGYLLYFGGAKQSKTREARIEKHEKRILGGLGLMD